MNKKDVVLRNITTAELLLFENFASEKRKYIKELPSFFKKLVVILLTPSTNFYISRYHIFKNPKE